MPIQSEHPRTSESRLTDANGGRFINEFMIGFGLLPDLLLVRASKNGDVRHRIYEQTLGPDVFLASVKASQKVLVGALPTQRHRMSGRQVAQTVGRRKNHSTVYEVRESQLSGELSELSTDRTWDGHTKFENKAASLADFHDTVRLW
jgi:hypothetical protein